VKEGKLRALAVGSATRSSQMPEIPTLAESGMPGFDADSMFGIYVPAGTPAAVVVRLHDEINKAIRTAVVTNSIKGLGAESAALTQKRVH
jgi:tripartite-type tricarboxylate transporter receptor subunit TctC